MKKQGIFIAIEGGDGSGKKTQSDLLIKYLENKQKYSVFKVSFPQHGEVSAYYVDKYLNGDYGTADQVPGDLASLPYAIDRFAASKTIASHLKLPNQIVIADRYVASNLAHQGTKFANTSDRLEYYKRDMATEYDLLGIPKPDLNIVLNVPAEIAQKNVDKKDERNYTKMKRDIHEADTSHLLRANANYIELCKLYPEMFISIDCMKDGKLRSIEDIHSDVTKIVDDFIGNKK